MESEEDSVTALHLASCLLPIDHRQLLEALIELLNWISEYKDENKMDRLNLATVMAPNILYPKDNLKDESFLAIKVVHSYLENSALFRQVFNQYFILCW